MVKRPNPLESTPPAFGEQAARQILREGFGVESSSLKPLHSYAGLYDWAVHHRLGGWQAMSWPAEIDVFLAVGELALYVAYLDCACRESHPRR
jgi:hypothetical protein